MLLLPRALDYCTSCFALQCAGAVPGQWVTSITRDDHPEQLACGKRSTAAWSNFYFIHQGTYGMPGLPPAVYLLNAAATGKMTRTCLWQRETTLVWDICAEPSDCGVTADCNDQGYEAVDAGTHAGAFFLRRSGCNAGVNCTLIGTSPAVSSGNELLRMVASQADAVPFEAICTPCPQAKLDVAGAIVLGLIGFTVLLPLMIYGVLRWQWRRQARTRESVHTLMWPKRQRSRTVFVCFQLGWTLAVLGSAPSILWRTGRWWSGDVSGFYGAVPMGFLLMTLVLRPDDDPWIFSVFSLLSIALLLTLTAMRVAEAWDWWASTPRVATNAMVTEMLRSGVTMAIVAMCSCLLSMWAIVTQIPIHTGRMLRQSCSHAKEGAAALSNEALYSRLIWSIRTGILFALCASVVNLCKYLAIGRRQSEPFDWVPCMWTACLGTAYLMTSIRARLLLHMGTLHLIFMGDRTSPPALPASVANSEVCRAEAGVREIESHPVSLMFPRDELWQDRWLCDLSEWQQSGDEDPLLDNLEIGHLLGSGYYSRVYCGTSSSSGRSFAIKVFRSAAYNCGRDAATLRGLLAEVALATRLEHHNLIHTHCCGLIGSKWPALVMDLMDLSLDGFLHRREAWMPPIKLPLQRQLALDVAQGLAYLHDTVCVMHRDIKPMNILLNKDLSCAKIADFGLATRFGMETSGAVGTVRYMAPEVLIGVYGYKADVFSYAITLWELMHARRPYHNLISQRQVTFAVHLSQRPQICLPPSLEPLASLIASCWDKHAGARPEMHQVCAQLLELPEEVRKQDWNQPPSHRLTWMHRGPSEASKKH